MLRRRYHWVIFGVAFLTLIGAAGFRSAPSVLLDPLNEEFGWGRGLIGSASSINLLLFGLAGPFAAALMQRYGLRRVVTIALVVVSVGALLTTQMTEPWHLMATWGVIVGAGSGCMATVFAATVATRWFVSHRGIVIGALTAASATGQLIFLPLLANLAEHHGWRTVSITIAAAALAVVPLVAFLIRDWPADVGLLPLGATTAPPPPPRSNPVESAFGALSTGRRDPRFWLLFSSFFVCGLSTNGLVGQHFVSAAHDHGISHTTAGSLLALVGVFDVIGTVASGWLTDRYDPRYLLAAYYALRGASLLTLHEALDVQHAGLMAFMVFYGLDWVATVPPTVALCNKLFGIERGPTTYGWVFFGHQLGAALAATGAGWLRDTTGSYRPAFVIAGLACGAAAIAVIPLRSGARPALVES